MQNKKNIVIATTKSWNIENSNEFIEKNRKNYSIKLITNKNELSYKLLKKFNPDYVLFPHWSWIIPEEIFSNFECIVFHMTDLPFGRGGSPLQNLLVRGIHKTKISALKVESGIDTGPIYLKKELTLKKGSAEDIFKKASNKIFNIMIPTILDQNLQPKQQVGKVSQFKRRTPEEGNMLAQDFTSLDQIYDFIRMLDGEGYPPAFIKFNNIRLTFKKVKKKSDLLYGKFEINYEK